MSATVTLHPRREKSLQRRHPWVFAGAVASHSGKIPPGATVEVHGHDGRWLARGAWSPRSQIRVRIWTFDENEVVDNALFLRRLEAAVRGRAALTARSDLNAYRLVAAEADGLPGVIVDRYDQLLVCQLLSAGAERQRDKLVWGLRRLFPDSAILERSDAAVREKEGLEPLVQVLHGEVPDEVEILENGHRFLVDVKQGHKTGFYLDQRDNRALIAAHAADREVLNCFSYSGAIAVYCLAAGARRVLNYDLSEPALALAARQVALNGHEPGRAEFRREDVFQALRALREEAAAFDLVVLDPPKFADSKNTLTRACRGYQDINRLAMQLIRPDGLLFTFSCSGLMPEELFQKVVADAALDAGRELQFLGRMGQACDHPVASSHPEGSYLKGLVCRVL